LSSVERFAALQAYIHTTLPRINTVIRHHLDSKIWLIRQISEYLIASGGKRLRPIIHLLCAQACGVDQKSEQQHDDIYTLAAVLELIHTATLLHDDVVDHSDLRRGKATANATFGNAASVLSGDFLYSRAFQMMVSLKRLSVMDILSSATNIIAEGEVLQLLYAGEARITETQYREMIESKTAKLFEAAAELGAVLADRTEYQTTLAQYGKHVGVAFQLIDDLLDYSSHADTLGKNTGDDLEEGKWTLPLLIAFERGTSAERAELETIVQAKSREGLTALNRIFEQTQALQATEEAAQQEAQLAIQALSPIPSSQYKDLLIELARFAVYRSA
jgi:octaprenyl-diphosphate synthase